MGQMPVLIPDKCTGCGLCVSVCSCNALVLVDNNLIVIEAKIECNWCTQCEAVCPTGAISCPFEIVMGDF